MDPPVENKRGLSLIRWWNTKSAVADGPTPFRLHIPDSAIEDLRSRLARTRFPDEPPLEPWRTGTSLSYLEDLVRYWQSGFDWRAQERDLNRFRQFTVPLGGIELHFIHEPGRGPDPIPLLLSHGWPGSIVEFRRLIPLLTERFTVVAPSLPGYTLSFRRGQKRFAVDEIADLLARLMSEVLGYERFAAQGGDWGAFVSSVLGWRHPQKLIGIHLNLLAVRRDPKEPAQTREETEYLSQLAHWLKEETGYLWIQGTKPQTLAYALTDSPAGLAAWIAEKFWKWSDCDGVIENAVSREDLLTNVSLYWFTGAIGSSFWPYYARMHGAWPIPEGRTVDVPTAYAAFPKEILRPPRSLAARMYTDIRRWTVMPRGGHFAALEQPQSLARDILEFFNALQ
jgi:pimeloyl-ACP methyl ester carboxylesterase